MRTSRRGANRVEIKSPERGLPLLAGFEGVAMGRYASWGVRDSVSLAVLLLLLAGFIVLRGPIVGAAPGLASLYARLGFDVNLRGLDFGEVTSFRDNEAGRPGLVVGGEIRNASGAPKAIPPIRLVLLDDRDQEVLAWTAAAEQASVGIGGSARFQTRIVDPPEGARRVSVRFGPAMEGKT
jgi:hypothetical protein